MSLKMILSAMETNVGDKTAKLVLIKLADNANEQGECWPSYETIAKVCECSVKTAQRKIALLEEKGLLIKTARKGEKGNQSNLYKLIPPSTGRQNDQKGGSEIPHGGDKMTQGGGDKNDQSGGDKMTPKSVKLDPVITEPVIETLSRSGVITVSQLQDFVEHRKSIKRPMTNRAVEMFINRLHDLSKEGHDIPALVENAIISGWQNVYPDKQSTQGGNPKKPFPTRQEQRSQRNMEVCQNFINGGSNHD